MAKQKIKKPRTGTARKKTGAVQPIGSSSSKASGKGSRAVKRRKGKPPLTADKVYFVLATAVLILAVSAIALIIVYFHPAARFASSAQPELVQKLPVLPEREFSAEETAAGPAESGSSSLLPDPIAEPAAPAAETSPSGNITKTRHAEPRPADQAPAKPAVSIPAAPLPAASRPAGVSERPAVVSRGTLAFVIDDAGNNLRDLEPFLKFPGALTIAVLPGLPYSADAARRIRAAGKEVFLHQPMESIGGRNPGPGAIMSGMNREEIRAVIIRNLEELGKVAGINNHEGSRVTMDAEAMEIILDLCRERGLVFLDSRTTAETVAPVIARRQGIEIGERDVFIDNIQERESMLGYIKAGMLKAEQKGSAIMIGHTWSAELPSILDELYPNAKELGYSFSYASALVH